MKNKMKDSQRDNIIARLEKCRNTNEEFYKRHSDLLEELNYKINALKSGADYEIKDAGWVVGYVGGKIRETNFKYNKGKIEVIEYKNKITEERAKEIYKKLFLK